MQENEQIKTFFESLEAFCDAMVAYTGVIDHRLDVAEQARSSRAGHYNMADMCQLFSARDGISKSYHELKLGVDAIRKLADSDDTSADGGASRQI